MTESDNACRFRPNQHMNPQSKTERVGLNRDFRIPKRSPKLGKVSRMTLSLRKQGDVFALPVPGRTDKGDREALYFDEGDPKISAHRLALRVRENGSPKWIYFYRWGGKQQRYTIGDASDDPNGWTLAKARGRAHELIC
jgi:Arm DNA-binding domain